MPATPIFLYNVGDSYNKTCLIDTILIKGTTAVTDVFTLVDPTDSTKIIFDGNGSTLTFAMYPFPTGIQAPNGFKLQFKTIGSVCVYIR